MRHLLSRHSGSGFSALLFTACTAGMLHAQDVQTETSAIPSDFQSVPGLRKTLSVLGSDTYISTESEFVWMRDPDTGYMIAGFVFDPDGKNFNPAQPNAKDLDLQKFIDQLHPREAIHIPSDLAPDVAAALSGLSAEHRQAAIDDLIVRIRPVEGESDFRSAVGEWLETIEKNPD